MTLQRHAMGAAAVRSVAEVSAQAGREECMNNPAGTTRACSVLWMDTINWSALCPRLYHVQGEAEGQLQLTMTQVPVMPELTQATQGEDMSFQVCQHCCAMSPASSWALITGRVAASMPTALLKWVQQSHKAPMCCCKQLAAQNVLPAVN